MNDKNLNELLRVLAEVVIDEESATQLKRLSMMQKIIKEELASKPNPRTKTVYEKVHNSESIKAVMNGSKEYWCKSGDSWVHLNMDSPLEQFCRAFKKAKKEIDWKEELIAFLKKEKVDGGTVNGWGIGDNDDKFSTISIDFDLRDKRFIAMCHLVESLTNKP